MRGGFGGGSAVGHASKLHKSLHSKLHNSLPQQKKYFKSARMLKSMRPATTTIAWFSNKDISAVKDIVKCCYCLQFQATVQQTTKAL